MDNDVKEQQLEERDFAPNVGGGVDRDKLKDSDFVMPGRKFPVMTPTDVKDAVSSFGRAKGVDFNTFKKNMIALCRRKGKAFMAALPDEWKKEMNMESAAPDKPTKATVLIEALDLSEAQIDTDHRTVRQVLIKAGDSKNRRRYSEKVLQSAAPLFEGVKTYANHPGKDDLKNRPERSVREITGWVDSVIFENGAIVGTRHFTQTEAGKDSWALVEQIVSGQAPVSLMGASINAVGTAYTEKTEAGDVLVIESIEGVHSVDDVTTPAAGGGFLRLVASESEDMTQALVNAMSYTEWLEARPEFVEKFKTGFKKVRLEEETQAQIAAADAQVSAANEKLTQAQTALTEAQDEKAALSAANDKLMAQIEALSVRLAVIEALEGLQLPAAYVNDLRDSLPKLPREEWAAKIETEKNKAKRAGHKPQVEVKGASVQVAEAVNIKPSREQELVPRDGESITAWQARTAHLRSS